MRYSYMQKYTWSFCTPYHISHKDVFVCKSIEGRLQPPMQDDLLAEKLLQDCSGWPGKTSGEAMSE